MATKRKYHTEADRRLAQAATCRRYRARNPAKRKETIHKYYLANKDKKFQYEKKRRKKPEVKERILELKRKRNKDKYYNDPQYRADTLIRRKITHALKKYGDVHTRTAYDRLIGCTPYEYKRYIEAQFKPGMTWKNIHIDHIIPSSSFDLLCEKQVRKCFHYTNCQPLFPIDNIRKKNKIL